MALVPVVLSAAAAVVLGAGASAAQPALSISSSIDGRPLDEVSSNRALRLSTDRPAEIALRVDNPGPAEVFIRSVRLDAKIGGLTFFAFETRVDLRVEAGDQGERSFSVDLVDLGRQATGLLPARLALLDADRSVVASQSFPADVRGSLRSAYGLFGVMILVITGLQLASVLTRLAAHRLPANRWRRALRFAVPGIGIGLTITFSLSVFRIMVPSTSRWLVLVVVFGGALFVAGYLSPAPGTGDPDDSDDGAPGARAAAGAPAGAPSGAPSGARDTLGSPGAPPPP